MSSPSSSPSQPIAVAGAGLAGAMMALMLARRGERVILFEGRDDWREQAASSAALDADQVRGQLTDARTRSINLALSYRGIAALKRVGVYEQLEPLLIPMVGRAVHKTASSGVQLQPYGTGDQAIYSISRTQLNDVLLAALDEFPAEQVEVRFGAKIRGVKPDGTVLLVKPDDALVGDPAPSVRARFVVGADGAYSAVRRSLLRYSRAGFSQDYLSHGYKELTIPPTEEGEFALEPPEALHIWPRHEFMLIALPNTDKSFTCTLFAPFDGEDGLDSITTPDEAHAYLSKYFPDAYELMPDGVDEFMRNPSSALTTVRLSKWNLRDKIVLVGDAAHAVVPFYGQGMNSAFEDCLVFDETWDECGGDPAKVLPRFNQVRQPIGDALADLSINNYREMRSLTAKPWFVAKKQVERVLHATMPNTWVPLYTMVSFTRIPYHKCVERAKRQDKYLGAGLVTLGAALVLGAVKYGGPVWARVVDTVKALQSSL